MSELSRPRRVKARGLAAITAVAIAFVMTAASVVSFMRIHVTAGWYDQSVYHMPTVFSLASELPKPDIVNVNTATGPLYHLLLAVPTRLFHLNEAQAQFLGVSFAVVAILALAYYYRESSESSKLLVFGLAMVFTSPYVWESTLWAATDTAALLTSTACLANVARNDNSNWSLLLSGLLAATAICTRQTYVWLLAPVLLVPFMRGASIRCVASFSVLPGLGVLSLLVFMWGGLTPPGFFSVNGSHISPAGLSFGMALALIFLLPLVIMVGFDLPCIRRMHIALALGALSALPAVLWTSGSSSFRFERTGGWLWEAVKFTGTVNDRSWLLVALSYAGGVVTSFLFFTLKDRFGGGTAILTATSLVGGILSASTGAQLYQKYFEIPILSIVLVILPAVFALRTRGLWPLAGPLGIQALASIAIVLVPILLL